ncbi:hypothetical protein ACWIUD_01675 [Helicobacter sp. 23-1044]
MSIKNNLNFIKNEFSSDEKIIEGAFKLEILYRRYRHIIWGAVIAVIALFAVLGIKNYIAESNAKKSSAILEKLLENPSDETLRADLQKSNKNLYELFLLKDALNNGNIAQLQEVAQNADKKNANESDLAQFLANYHFASFERDVENLSKSGKFAIGDFAKVQEAYLLLKDGKISEAKNILSAIPSDSTLKELVDLLYHSTINLHKEHK